MRILHLLQNFPPEFTGGTERYVLQLALAQQERGHRVVVVCGSEQVRRDGEQVPFRVEGLECIRLHRRPEETYGVLPRHPRLGAAVAALAARERIDQAHLHHWYHLDLDLARRLRRAGVPVLLTLHDFYTLCPRFFRRMPGEEDICRPGRSLGECGECLAAEAGPGAKAELAQRRREFAAEFAAAGRAVLFSRAMLEFFRRAPGLPPVDWRLLPPGIHRPGRWREAALAAPTGPPWPVGSWGGICRDKGLDLAVAALAREEFRGRVALHLWGEILEEDFAGELRKRAAAAGLPLHLHGPVAPAELPRRAAGLACALFPSRCFESYGLVVDEAMLLGLPVVVAETGALAERLGEGGVAFPRGDTEALARALVEMLADPPAWRRRARGQAVPDFEKHVEAVLDLYGESPS